MTTPETTEPTAGAGGEGGADTALVNPCESCGVHEARYVVADLQERDTSLFCPACIVLTFAKVASEIGAGA